MTQSSLSTEDLVSAGRNDEDPVAAEPDTPTAATAGEEDLPLLEDAEAAGFLDRWRSIQTSFVDDPQAAVRDGDTLVAELMQSLAQRFSQYKHDLEAQWQRGAEPETETLRVALQQYRSFFHRLLST